MEYEKYNSTKGGIMLYIGLRKELPRRRQEIRTRKETKKPTVVTISLVHPPRSYRSTGLPKVIKIYV